MSPERMTLSGWVVRWHQVCCGQQEKICWNASRLAFGARHGGNAEAGLPPGAPMPVIVTTMDTFEPSAGCTKHVSRRRALWLAGAAGLGAVASACSTDDRGASVTESATPAADSVTPSAAPVSSVAPVPPPKAITAPMLCRESWGALAPLPGDRRPNIPITRMTIHHTAVYLGDNSNAPARLRQHQAFHQNQRGWFDIAYHVSVDRNGNIYQLRAPEIAGDTATNYDPAGHFLVVCEGNFDEENVSQAQLDGAAMAFAWASQQYDVSPEVLDGHRDNSHDTACPGADLYSYVINGDLKRRVAALVAAGGVDLQTICGPEAAAVVASIENGTQPPRQ